MGADDKMDGLDVYKRSLWGALAHAFCLWATLAISYNSYKAAVRSHAPLSREMRDSIQSAFPWVVIVFTALYLAFMARSRAKGRLLSARHYLYAGAIYVGLINALFVKKGKAALIVLDSSALLFLLAFILLSWAAGLMAGGNGGRLAWLFAVVAAAGAIYDRLRARPAALLIGAAVSLILLSAFLLAARQVKPAQDSAYASFILLAGGVGIEVYGLVRGPKRD